MRYLCLIPFLLASLQANPDDLPKLVRRVEPSIVTILSYDSAGNLLIQGSGFLVDEQGDLITSRHIIAGASRIEVKAHGGRTYHGAKVVAQDAHADLAMIALGKPLFDARPLRIQQRLPEVGEAVVVVGSPLGFSDSVSNGIVSGIRTVAGSGLVGQMTAPISAGSSGSPVINLKGEVIGVTKSQRLDGQNLNFFVPGKRILTMESFSTRAGILSPGPAEAQRTN